MEKFISLIEKIFMLVVLAICVSVIIVKIIMITDLLSIKGENKKEYSLLLDKDINLYWKLFEEVDKSEFSNETYGWYGETDEWHRIKYKNGIILETIKYSWIEDGSDTSCVYKNFYYPIYNNDEIYYICIKSNGEIDSQKYYEYKKDNCFIEHNSSENGFDLEIDENNIKKEIEKYKEVFANEKKIMNALSIVRSLVKIVIAIIFSILSIKYFKYIKPDEIISVPLHLMGDVIFIIIFIPLLWRIFSDCMYLLI